MSARKSTRAVAIRVDDLEWDDENMHHCGRHSLSWWDGESVLRGSPRFFVNTPSPTGMERRGTHKMIGADATGRLCTFILAASAKPGVWRPVTGWPSKDQEIDTYRMALAPLQRGKRR